MPRKPLTEEQKIKKRIGDKKYKDANKEKIAQQNKKLYENNKQITIDRAKEWKKNNPDKLRISEQKYYKNNIDKFTQRRWKYRGIICDNWENIYRVYMATNKCDFCLEPFKDSRDRCLDHDHSILDSYNIRGILCQPCNIKDVLKDFPIKIYTEICE